MRCSARFMAVFVELLLLLAFNVVGVPIRQKNKFEFVGAFVFPHGTLALDPETRDFSKLPAYLPTSRDESMKLHSAMKTAAEDLIASNPDLIIMSTPHGLTLQNQYLFLGNKKAHGSAEWDGDWKDFKAAINLETELTKELVRSLVDDKNLVEIVAFGASEDPINLRWGEVVPWWFINSTAVKAGVPVPRAIILGQPRGRLTGTKEIIPELLKIGASVSKFLNGQSETEEETRRVAIVSSGDLSHYHSKLPTSPFQYSENASVFDKYVQNWAGLDYRNSLSDLKNMEENLLINAGDLSDSVRSCGYTGLVFLHGFMKHHLGTTSADPSVVFKSRIYHYSAPTYYGMLTSSWTK